MLIDHLQYWQKFAQFTFCMILILIIIVVNIYLIQLGAKCDVLTFPGYQDSSPKHSRALLLEHDETLASNIEECLHKNFGRTAEPVTIKICLICIV